MDFQICKLSCEMLVTFLVEIVVHIRDSEMYFTLCGEVVVHIRVVKCSLHCGARSCGSLGESLLTVAYSGCVTRLRDCSRRCGSSSWSKGG